MLMRVAVVLAASLLCAVDAGAATPPPAPPDFVLEGRGGTCLEVRRTPADPPEVQAQRCLSSSGQRWSGGANSALVGAGRLCLDFMNRAGTSVAVAVVCDGSARQRWRQDSGRLRNGVDLCLEAVGNAAGTVVVRSCSSQQGQRWRQGSLDPRGAVWKAQTVFPDARCTACRPVQRFALSPDGREAVTAYELPGLDDATAQWGDCITTFFACTKTGQAPLTCIDRATCPDTCRARFRQEAAGATRKGAFRAFKRIFVDEGARCRPPEADDEDVVP